MIKIEYVEGTGTVTKDGEDSTIFAGMVVTAEELVTLKATGDVVYCIDEARVIVVPKGQTPTVTTVSDEVAEVAEVTTDTEETNTEEVKTEEEKTEEVAPVVNAKK